MWRWYNSKFAAAWRFLIPYHFQPLPCEPYQASSCLLFAISLLLCLGPQHTPLQHHGTPSLQVPCMSWHAHRLTCSRAQRDTCSLHKQEQACTKQQLHNLGCMQSMMLLYEYSGPHSVGATGHNGSCFKSGWNHAINMHMIDVGTALRVTTMHQVNWQQLDPISLTCH